MKLTPKPKLTKQQKRESRDLVRSAKKRGLLSHKGGKPLTQEQTKQLFRDRHAAYMRAWRRKRREKLEALQLKLFDLSQFTTQKGATPNGEAAIQRGCHVHS